VTRAGLEERRRELVAAALAAVHGGAVEVRHMRLAAGGNSRECWIVQVSRDGAADTVVLRCDPDDWIRPQEMTREIVGMRVAERSGIPAPRVIATHEDAPADRPFVIVDFVPGESIPRRIHRQPEFGVARQRFAAQCGSILRRLHDSDPAGAHQLGTREPVAELERRYANASSASPVLAGALTWIREHQPGAIEDVVVHGDFRLGNMLIDNDGIAAVLDWETAHLGDPYEDLAWVCQRAWRYGGSEPVGGIGTCEDLLRAYVGDLALVDQHRLHWWSVWGATFWALASRELSEVRRSSAGDAMETAAIARQVCVQEQRVLEELAWYVR
jgi:aminoglycoside phosphotransferase (APT) family kinase protein